jgi:uncharacterized protein (DUF362 family)
LVDVNINQKENGHHTPQRSCLVIPSIISAFVEVIKIANAGKSLAEFVKIETAQKNTEASRKF